MLTTPIMDAMIRAFDWRSEMDASASRQTTSAIGKVPYPRYARGWISTPIVSERRPTGKPTRCESALRSGTTASLTRCRHSPLHLACATGSRFPMRTSRHKARTCGGRPRLRRERPPTHDLRLSQHVPPARRRSRPDWAADAPELHGECRRAEESVLIPEPSEMPGAGSTRYTC